MLRRDVRVPAHAHRPCAEDVDGAMLRVAERRKRAAYPELARGGHSAAPCSGQRGWRQMERGGALRARSRQAACPACPPGSSDSCRGGLVETLVGRALCPTGGGGHGPWPRLAGATTGGNEPADHLRGRQRHAASACDERTLSLVTRVPSAAAVTGWPALLTCLQRTAYARGGRHPQRAIPCTPAA